MTAARSIPASRNHKLKDENISNKGNPAEMPKNNIVITRGCLNDFRVSNQVACEVSGISFINGVFRNRN